MVRCRHLYCKRLVSTDLWLLVFTADIESVFWVLVWLMVAMREADEPHESWIKVGAARDVVFPGWHLDYTRFQMLTDPEWWSSSKPLEWAPEPNVARSLLLPSGPHRDKYITAIHRFQQILRQGYATVERGAPPFPPIDQSIYDDIRTSVLSPLPRRSKSLVSVREVALKEWMARFSRA